MLVKETLQEYLKPYEVNFEKLHQEYRPMLRLVKELIGVVPNCDPILEIWPTGFRTYNLFVPNFLNLPHSLFGKKELKSMMGLAMYTSSRAAECMYCSAHCCSYALRRGLSEDAITGVRTLKEKSVVTVSKGLATVPASLKKQELIEFRSHFTQKEEDWIVFSTVLMGFLNKFMDAVGVELEPEAIHDVGELLYPTGWTHGKHLKDKIKSKASIIEVDNFKTFFRVIKEAPGAIKLEKNWTKEVPNTGEKASFYLQEYIGYSFPILKNIKHKRIVTSLTTILRDNLNSKTTVIGLPVKVIVGYIFAIAVENENLELESIALAKVLAPELNEDFFFTIKNIFVSSKNQSIEVLKLSLESELEEGVLSELDLIILLLAKGMASSPSAIESHLIALVEENLKPEIVVEVAVWISIQQAIHRLDRYYEISNQLE
ncbi:hypothetical protein [uncultured Aquimarina sp.]|uniref:hypothetical protein n=1 Tax=uncultured Aquimarina sp. TaxID=575652 RepID=UPI002639AD73|nr:hypothetical protein [uncultured Aquimarina sp.]